MSKIVIECSSKLYPLAQPPSSFVNLIDQIETLVPDLPNLYSLYSIDEDNDLITIGSQQDLETNIQYFLQTCPQDHQRDFIIHIKEADLSKSFYCVKRQPNKSDSASSEIINNSLAEQKLKLEELKRTMGKQPPPKEEYQESVYQKKEGDLSIEQIMTYYRNVLVKCESSYAQLPLDQRNEKAEMFRKSYGRLVERLQQKLTSYFHNISKYFDQEVAQVQLEKVEKPPQEEKVVEQVQRKGPIQYPILEDAPKPIQVPQETKDPIILKAREMASVLQQNYEECLAFVRKFPDEDVNSLMERKLDG